MTIEPEVIKVCDTDYGNTAIWREDSYTEKGDLKGFDDVITHPREMVINGKVELITCHTLRKRGETYRCFCNKYLFDDRDSE